MGQSRKDCPNTFIISNPPENVKGNMVKVHNFCGIYNLDLFTLYNIPSCNIQIPELLYSYKEVIPMYT